MERETWGGESELRQNGVISPKMRGRLKEGQKKKNCPVCFSASYITFAPLRRKRIRPFFTETLYCEIKR